MLQALAGVRLANPSSICGPLAHWRSRATYFGEQRSYVSASTKYASQHKIFHILMKPRRSQ